VVGGAVWVLLGVALVFVMPERNFQLPADLAGARIRDTIRAMRGQLGAGARAVRHRPVLRYLFFAAFFVALASEGIDRLSQPLFLVDLTFPRFGTHAFWFGLFSIGATAGSIGLTEAISRRVDAVDPARVARLVIAFQTACVIGVFGFALAREFWLAAAAMLAIGLLRASIEPLLATWLVAETQPATRATVLSFMAQTDAAGQIAGGPPIGLLGQRLSIRAALVGVGFLLSPAVALFAGALKTHRKVGAVQPPAGVR
jgi:DHA3 family tetracycline resistance protein-like MFS transporter